MKFDQVYLLCVVMINCTNAIIRAMLMIKGMPELEVAALKSGELTTNDLDAYVHVPQFFQEMQSGEIRMKVKGPWDSYGDM